MSLKQSRMSEGFVDGDEELMDATESARRRRTHYLGLPVSELKKICDSRGLQSTRELATPKDKLGIILALEADEDSKLNWVNSQNFEMFFGCVVILNAVAIGIQIDFPKTFMLREWLVINLLFFAAFCGEIGLKLRSMGWHEYIKDNWNIFDVVVTILAAIQIGAYYSFVDERFYDEWSKYVAGDFVQMLRLCRLARLARVFSELGMLITSFVSSLKALFWIALLALLWFYVCACIGAVFIGRREFLPAEEEEAIRELRHKFSTIPLSMFALFEVMTLEGWTDYVRPLMHTRMYLVFFFLFFIFVTAFFMLNLVTAVVVDRTVAAQKSAEDLENEEKENERNAHIKVIYEILNKANTEAGGVDMMPRELFDDTLRDLEIADSMRHLEWSPKYLQSMFALIDYDNDGEASLAAFQKLLEASKEALDTTNYVRFQINLAHRLEFQEKLTLTVLHALEKISDQKFPLPDSMDKLKR